MKYSLSIGILLKLSLLNALVFLAACAPIGEHTRPIQSAESLALSQLPSRPALAKKVQNIVDLPTANTETTRQSVNQTGSLPQISTQTHAQPLLSEPVGEDIVSLNFENTALRDVIQGMFDVLNLTVVIDPSIGDKITMRTAPDKPLKQKDIWPMMQLLLYDNGLLLEKKGKIYHLRKETNAIPLTFGRASKRLSNSSSPEVMQITPLRYITLEAAINVLKPMVEPEGRLISLPTLNIVGIITSPTKLQRLNRLLTLIDADPFTHRGIRLFRLNNAKASEAKSELEKILKAIEGKTPAYSVVSLERINALLVIAPPNRGFRDVDRWVEIIDEAGEAGGEQVFVYNVRNLKATSLASTLSEVFKLDDDKKTIKANNKKKAKKTEKTTQPTANFIAKSNNRTTAVSASLQVVIVADEDTNSLIVRSSPKDYRQLLSTISLLDVVPKEAMINIIIAEVELTKEHQFGIDWSVLFGNRKESVVGTNFSNVSSVGPASIGVSLPINKGIISFIGSDITAILNALNTNGHVELLSRPSILVRNNQEASINVGSDEPTITRVNQTSSVNSSLTTSNEVQYRKTGIILKVKPQINNDGIINMDIRQEVSALGATRTEENLPSFRERVIETSLVVRDGTAIVMGGLIQTNWNNDFNGVPYAEDVPVLGNLFRSETVRKVRTELVVIIVPQIIDPEADNHQYVRFFRDRMKEVKRLMENDDTPVLLDVNATEN